MAAESEDRVQLQPTTKQQPCGWRQWRQCVLPRMGRVWPAALPPGIIWRCKLIPPCSEIHDALRHGAGVRRASTGRCACAMATVAMRSPEAAYEVGGLHHSYSLW